jgi:hypothetical protein
MFLTLFVFKSDSKIGYYHDELFKIWKVVLHGYSNLPHCHSA